MRCRSFKAASVVKQVEVLNRPRFAVDADPEYILRLVAASFQRARSLEGQVENLPATSRGGQRSGSGNRTDRRRFPKTAIRFGRQSLAVGHGLAAGLTISDQTVDKPMAQAPGPPVAWACPVADVG